ncbi:MAG TPA: SDR family oxidoreductase [Arenicellales bacterium]|jgi:NAD(P)-dependent dehydrogenase (short-subunit alcohol dehydrogenase family)|nr:SDR family oxidoreductase [Pseudomonadales bacterium]MDP7314669.1 SDR family oxidoreductase [Pseudomonadales bacterium]HJL53940.1 SDR family oxidoreductase [Arenicellales bacterium]|tara:strand:- start:6999 stop:7763 length:765 start_codon:yes stop_codon:yes gene_type:complete
MSKLEGRTALITGASRGIGRAIAERFAQEGANVAINYSSNEAAAQEVARVVTGLGCKAHIYQANVGDETACSAMVEQAISDFGQIDVLVNNAGLGSAAVNRPAIADATNEQWNTLLDVNLWGPIYLCRSLVPHMREADRSDVIMISSIAAQALNPGFGVYAVSKAALEAMAHTLAREEKSHGMRVNMIAPGLVDTDMGRRIVEATGGGSDIRKVDARMPFGFVCTPADIAATVAHLCSKDGRYITNQRITITGD